MPIHLKKWLTYAIIKPIRDLFAKFPEELKKAVHVGVVITENLKKFVDSGVADVITAIIPGDWDDDLKIKLRQQLPIILVNLKLADACADETDPDKIVACAIKTLQSIEGNFNSAFLHSLSILIADIAADGKLSWSDGVYVLQYYYDHVHENKLPDLPETH